MILQKWFNLSSEEMINAQLRLFEVENEFFAESLRNAALVGTSKLDILLGDVLVKFMRKPYSGNQQNIIDRLTFDMKINLSYGLGLIDEQMARLLHYLRKIRNTFAHQLTPKDIDIKELNKYHSGLRDEYMYMIVYASYSNNEKITNETQRILLTILMYLVMLLNYYADRVLAVNDEDELKLKSILPTCKIKKGATMELIEPINLDPATK